MSLIKQLHHSSLLVSDLEKARSFYEGIFGLTPSNLRPPMAFDGIWYEIGPQQIHLLALPNPDAERVPPPHGGRDRHTALIVNDFEELIARLDKAGVTYTFSQSGRKALFCRDPDGNTFELLG
jgi:glyoxylase I family protein